MAKQVGDKYQCGFCGKLFKKPNEADACKLAHDLIYIPMTPSEVNRLMLYMFTREDKHFDSALVERIRRYAREHTRVDKS